MRKRSWTKEDLYSAIQKSKNLSETALALGLCGKGGAIGSVKKGIIEFGFSTDHFSTQSKCHPDTVEFLSDDEIFSNNGKASRRLAKARIKRKNIIPYVCSECGQRPFYNGKNLTLQLEHKNGDNKDHRLKNLTFLCPNCHSQTGSYCKRKEYRE